MRLGATDLVVSRLGFGTAALGRRLTRSERVRVLETAYESGITHFDTAPLYGGGAAEEALGAFLRGGSGRSVTIATKVGIRPPSTVSHALSRLARRPSPARGGLFAPGDVRASLEGSLRRLRASRIDLLLLHEVQASDIDDALLETLAEAVAKGTVGELGIATSAGESAAILARAARFPAVVQTAVSPDPPAVGDRGLILHSTIAGKPGDPCDLLRTAAANHPSALLLFGSGNPAHIRAAAASVLG